MLNDIVNLIVKLLLEGTGAKLRETLGAVSTSSDLPYGTAIGELLKQQNLLEGAELEKILGLVLSLLGVTAAPKKAEAPCCEDCPYYQKYAEEKQLALPEKMPLEFDMDRAPTTMPYALALPDTAAAAEEDLLLRIRALSSGAVS